MKKYLRFLAFALAFAMTLGSMACADKKAPNEVKAPDAKIATPAVPAPNAVKVEAAPLTCDDGSVCPVE